MAVSPVRAETCQRKPMATRGSAAILAAVLQEWEGRMTRPCFGWHA